MTDKPDHTRLAALGEADRDSGAGIFSAAARRPWATPQVILGTMEDTKAGAGTVTDGAPASTNDS